MSVGDVTLHVAMAGTGPTVVLLHGFPECWSSWRAQIAGLAAAGFRVIAPDMRGYAGSQAPHQVSAYRLTNLVQDVRALLDAVGAREAAIVGHDWGAIVAWAFAEAHPTRVKRLIILNVPHPEVMQRALRRPKQMRKSWYLFFFQLPWLPERILALNDYASMRRLFERDGIDAAHIDELVAAAKLSGMRGPINYYRAAMRSWITRTLPRTRRIDAPTLVIWGEGDIALLDELATPPSRWVPNARVEYVPGGTHWVQQKAPARVTELIREFLSDWRSGAVA